MKFKICVFDEKDNLLYTNVEEAGENLFPSPMLCGYYLHVHDFYMFIAGEYMEAYYE